MREKEGYTQAFWNRAIELTLRIPKECELCHRANGWMELGANDRPKKPNAKPLLVRAALRVGKKLIPSNLGLFCVRCKRGEYSIKKLSHEELSAMIVPMFQ